MLSRQAAIERTTQATCVQTNGSAYTHNDATNERLEEFIRYFVKESEAKLYSYHLVLEGELKRSGKFTKAFSEAIGLGIGGTAGIVGVLLGLPAQGTKVVAKGGKFLGGKVGDKIGNESYANHVRQLYDFVNLSQKHKATFRKILVETGFDIFQSFEMQFMGVSVKELCSDAMHVLAKDAINRAVSYLKNNKSASLPEAILLGESKRKDLESISPGFSVTYKSHSLKKEWNTRNLYSKVGLLIVEDGKSRFFRKKEQKESKTGKYGYRRRLNQEKWDVLSKAYIRDDIAESKSGHFTEYEYSLHLEDMEVQCKSILQRINLNDKDLAEDRIKELLDEVKKDILDEINLLKKQSQEYPKDRETLAKLEKCVNNFSSEEHLKRLKLFFNETKAEITKLIKESSKDVSEQMQNMSNNNVEQHRTTQATLETLREEMEMVHKEQKRSAQISLEIVDGVEKVNQNVEALAEQQRMRNMVPFWFGMREGTESFTGRENHLSQIAEYVQKGMVVITGLSGVGKSELAIKYAYTQHKRYSSVIWINAVKRETVKQSFFRLCKKLKMKIYDETGDEKDIESIAEDVYNHLSRQKCLFIFDDVEKYDMIKDILPRGLPPNVNKPDVLITSHQLEVKRGVALPLGDFSIDESVDFIKTCYCVERDAQIDEMLELAKKLHNFPLALQQSVAYILKQDKDLKNVDPKKEFTIRDYLGAFDRKAEDLLKCEMFQKLGNDYKKTTYTALEVTLSRIRNQKEGSQQAMEILHNMAYFSPDNIPASFFLKSVNEDDDRLGATIQLLKDYSIVSGQGLLTIHGLVQKVIRLELAKEVVGKPVAEEAVLRRVLERLMKYMTNYQTMELYIPHIVSVWTHASKYNALIETFIVNYLNDSIPYTTYFHIIMESSPFGIVTNLIKKIEENYPEELDKVINRECRDGTTPLHRAAMSGDEQKVKLLMRKGEETVQDLLRKGVNVNPQTKYNFTPLHFAVKGKHLETVNFLLTQGTGVTMKTNRGFTPLHFAVITGRIDIVEALLNCKASVTDKTRHQYTPLHLAAKEGYVEILNLLLQRGANIGAKTRLKFTPLHFASEKGHLPIVKALCGRKAAVNVKDESHFTPLHLAALHGHGDVVFTLLKHGAQVNARTTKDNTPLHFASQKGHFEVVKTLVTNNAELDIRNDQGKTALDLAVEGNFVEIRDHLFNI